MWNAIICSLVCFAIATLCFTPQLRSVLFYRALSVYFLFEGIFSIANFIIFEIWPRSSFTMELHSFGVILVAGYLLWSMHVGYNRQHTQVAPILDSVNSTDSQ